MNRLQVPEWEPGGVKKLSTKKGEKSKSSKKGELPPKSTHSSKERIASTTHNRTRSTHKTSPAQSAGSGEMVPGHQRVPSVTKAADVALIAPDAPIILFM
uniref:Uncharacterized protein n=1 Tax=Acrobeloides nanus TaxID=290746 RepID=A0A914CWN6_9BILA